MVEEGGVRHMFEWLRRGFGPEVRAVCTRAGLAGWLVCGAFAPPVASAATSSASSSGLGREPAPAADSKDSGPATPSEPDKESMGILEVEVDPSVADAKLLPSWVAERNEDLAARLPDAPGEQQWVSVKISGTTYDYRVTIVAVRDDMPVIPGGAVFACECSTEMLLERIDEGIVKVIGDLRFSPLEVEESERVESEPPACEPESSGEGGEQARKRVNEDRYRRLGPLGYIGVAEGVLGAGAVVTGVVLFPRGPDDIHEEGSEGSGSKIVKYKTTEVPGLMLAIAGGIVLVNGVILVTVDAVRRRRDRVAITPSLGNGRASISLVGRF